MCLTCLSCLLQTPAEFAGAIRTALAGGISNELPVKKLLLFVADALKSERRIPESGVLSNSFLIV